MFFLGILPHPRFILFPYTTLFRSRWIRHCAKVSPPGGRAISARALARHARGLDARGRNRSEEHTSELQSRLHLVCRLLLEKKKCTHNTTDLLITTHTKDTDGYIVN